MTEADKTFLHGARAQTMQRDLNQLRKAIRNYGHPDIQDSLDKCERWFSQLKVKSNHDCLFEIRLKQLANADGGAKFSHIAMARRAVNDEIAGIEARSISTHDALTDDETSINL